MKERKKVFSRNTLYNDTDSDWQDVKYSLRYTHINSLALELRPVAYSGYLEWLQSWSGLCILILADCIEKSFSVATLGAFRGIVFLRTVAVLTLDFSLMFDGKIRRSFGNATPNFDNLLVRCWNPRVNVL